MSSCSSSAPPGSARSPRRRRTRWGSRRSRIRSRATRIAAGRTPTATCGSTTRRFTFLCAPNDTHNCLLNAYVRSGVVTPHRPDDAVRRGDRPGRQRRRPRAGIRASARRGSRSPGASTATAASASAWCAPGFKAWVEAGFPRGADGRPPPEYFKRARDEWVRVPHDEAAAIVAAALEEHRETYTGEKGKERLLKQHYEPEMVEATQGRRHAGAEVPRRHAAARHDPRLRHVPAGELDGAARRARSARSGRTRRSAARGFDNYSLAHRPAARPPDGHRAADGGVRPERGRARKTVVVWGMNWITTKMPDAHWLTEARLKGRAWW